MKKQEKKEAEVKQQPNQARKPDYSDSRRTSGRGRVQLAVWVNETENGVRFGTKLEYQYLGNDDGWKTMDNPLPDQWLATAKMLSDADTWRHRYLQEKRKVVNGNGEQQ